ncbi:hypothetical protein [Sphingomonas cavernae]|uniref:Uncharacterized protein n=1 Tax=Sphingomonas cavernae TaxID=2320861 RepID=A0A418W628_9SPHN|nr:hypothetical protein [Sphingomonas cavernae]RJF85495.1 hypothetical protein D3876_16290 [Sphingomonas cavernae]
MSEERITERTDATGNVTERVIERGNPSTVVERRGSGGLVIAFILLIAVALVGFYLVSMNNQETRQTDAISRAADSVGEGARKAGDAADRAADKYTGDNK